MSSETSTEAVDVRLKPDTTSDQSLQPWQFFVLAALACATALTFIVRGQGLATVMLLTVIMGTVAAFGLAALRTVRPLFGVREEKTAMVGDRARAALEREKTLAVRAIKELEFDHAMGKIADEDFREMTGRLRARAIRLMKQLDAAGGYRAQIERDLAKRLGDGQATGPARPAGEALAATAAPASGRAAGRTCAACSTANDADARFCKSCGGQL